MGSGPMDYVLPIWRRHWWWWWGMQLDDFMKGDFWSEGLRWPGVRGWGGEWVEVGWKVFAVLKWQLTIRFLWTVLFQNKTRSTAEQWFSDCYETGINGTNTLFVTNIANLMSKWVCHLHSSIAFHFISADNVYLFVTILPSLSRIKRVDLFCCRFLLWSLG